MKKIQKKKTFIIISIIVCILAVVGVGSYALWQLTFKQTNENTIISACLDITYDNESSDINLSQAYPITDTIGLATEGYSFSLTNNCDVPINYVVAIEEVATNNASTEINDDYIKVSLDSGTPYILSSLDNITDDDDPNLGYTIRKTKNVAIRRIGAGATVNHNVKLWLDSHTPASEQNKTFISKVRITGGQGFNTNCYTLDGSGNLIAYNSDICGTYAVIPAEVDGIKVKTIKEYAFKKEIADYTNTGTTDTSQVAFSLVYNTNAIPVALGTATPEDIANLTEDDFYIIKYNLDGSIDLSTPIDTVLSNLETNISGSTVDIDDIAIYRTGLDDLPDQSSGIHEVFYNTSGTQVGSKTPSGTSSKILKIDSVDFTGAKNLEKIESLAFSNAPSVTSVSECNSVTMASVPVGITSVSFGTNFQNVDVRPAAFAKSNIDNLTIYTDNFKDKSYAYTSSTIDNIDEKNDIYVIKTGIFGDSTIGTLTIKKGASNSTLSAVHSYGTSSLTYTSMFKNSNINTISIDSGVTALDNYSFNGANINTIANNSTSVIGDNAFYSYVGSGKSLAIPNGVTSIGENAFRSFNGSNLTLGSNIVTIRPYAFYSYVGTNQSLVIPNSVTTIGNYSFNAFKGSSLTIGNNVQTIGTRGFFNYYGSGQTLTIPASVTSIGSEAIKSFNGNNLIFNEGLVTISDSAFNQYGRDKTAPALNFPSTLRSIGDYAFQFYNGEVNLNNGLQTIGGRAFRYYGGSGKNLVIPDSVTSIGVDGFRAFNGASLTIGKNVRTLGNYVFASYCKTITVKMTESEWNSVSKQGGSICSTATIVYDPD